MISYFSLSFVNKIASETRYLTYILNFISWSTYLFTNILTKNNQIPKNTEFQVPYSTILPKQPNRKRNLFLNSQLCAPRSLRALCSKSLPGSAATN